MALFSHLSEMENKRQCFASKFKKKIMIVLQEFSHLNEAKHGQTNPKLA